MTHSSSSSSLLPPPPPTKVDTATNATYYVKTGSGSTSDYNNGFLKKDVTVRGAPTCVLDDRVVNARTLGNMTNIGLSFFANLCGRNRGAFVLNPSDGNTWGCLSLPPNFAKLAGIGLDDDGKKKKKNAHGVPPLKDANAINDKFVDGNLTASEAVALLDTFVKVVYDSSPDVDSDPFACQVSGLAELQCDPATTISTIRSATLAGLFTPAPWATGGKSLSLDDVRDFYSRKDFRQMRSIGLNTVQIPFPVTGFQEGHEDNDDLLPLLTDILEMVLDADLQAILKLEGPDNDDSVANAANYAIYHADVVFGLTLPSRQTLRAARAASSSLKLLVPANLGDLQHLSFDDDENVFAAIDLGHTSTIGDIASSSSGEDRSKLFYHESMACIQRSPLEFSECYKKIPVLVSNGFDLAIDDCAWMGIRDPASKFIDYGQCNRFDETIGSKWWTRHRQSFAARQLFSYEQGLGWSFAAWKLFEPDSSSGDVDSVIHEPAELLALKNVVAAGLMPSLVDADDYDLVLGACLNPPVADFVMGDTTLAPTPAPLDCGDGWVDPDTGNCTYWVPPVPEPTEPPVTCGK